jgi:2-methylaconitate cis-trans-isomerase PrpF
MCVVVSGPTGYVSYATGHVIAGAEMDIHCRQIRPPGLHKALTGTASICTAAAASIGGTLPNRLAGQHRTSGDTTYRLGHPSGVIALDAQVTQDEASYTVEYARIYRTARRLAEGRAFLKHLYPCRDRIDS